MSSSFRHIDTARFMGSWPVLQDSATILPRTLHTSARILGTVRETSSGYDVVGQSFYVVVDGEPDFQVTFSGTIALTLDEVITQINADSQANISQDIAFRDNGFLLLKSPTTGTNSYLRIYTGTNPDVFAKLGLYSETESYGGDIASATHADPDRQVAMPDQMSVMEGEPLTARVINRALMQLSLQNDMVYNLTHRRRLARSTTEEIASYSSSTPEGYQFSGGTMVYVGPDTTPSAAQLAKYFQIIGPDGKEFTKEEITQLNDYPGTIYCVEVGEHLSQVGGAAVPIYETRVVSSVAIFTAADVESNIYVTVTMAGVPALSGIPLKIIRLISTTEAVFRPIDPVTGDDLVNDVLAEVGTGGAYASDIVRQSVELVPCQVEAVYDTAGGSRVEGVNTARVSSIVPTKVELGNRIVFSGETLVAAGVAIGDELIWSGHTPSSGVQDNNGTYRISAVIDEETVEVVTGTWEPAILTSDLFTAGTVDIQVDGVYVEDPFIKFVETPSGAIPEVGDSLTIQYYGMKTLKEAWDDDDTLISGDLERQHESSDIIEKAILNILGPSTNNLDEYVRQQASNNLEALDYRIDREHYRLGKHRTISADGIFVYQNATNNEYLDQRSPENWGAELATFWHRGDLGTGEAVASIVTKSTDVDPGGATDYIGGFKVFIEGASSDKNLWAYASDITVESDTDVNSSTAIGYQSAVNFSDGNIDTVAHFRGEIPTWTGTNSLTNEYGVYLPAMSRGGTQVGVQVDGMSGAATKAAALRAGNVSAPFAVGVEVNSVTGTSTIAYGFYTTGVTGETATSSFRSGGITSVAGNAAMFWGASVTGALAAYAVYTSGISAGTFPAGGVRIDGTIESTSNAAYGLFTGAITGGTSSFGVQVGNLSGTTGGAYGFYTGTIAGSTFGRGLRTAGITGDEAAGVIINGVITGASGEGSGLLVSDTISGTAAGHLVKSEAISSSAGDAGGLRTTSIDSTIASAYGVGFGAITGATVAQGVVTGAISSPAQAYGVKLGNISSGTGAAVGVFLGTVDSTSGVSTGFNSGVITGDTAARGVYIEGLALNVGGSGPSSALRCDSIAGTNAYGVYTGNMTADASTGTAIGSRFQIISGSQAYGLYASQINSSVDDAAAVYTGAIQGVRAKGVWVTSLQSTGGDAIGFHLPGVTASAAAYVVYTNAIVGTTFARGTRFTNISAEDSAGFLVNGNITGTLTNAYGLRFNGTISGVTNAYVVRAGALTASGGFAKAFLAGNVSATDNAIGLQIGTLQSTGASTWGCYFDAITGADAARGMEFISVESQGTTGQNAYGIALGPISQTGVGGGNAFGVDIGATSSTSASAYGLRVGATTAGSGPAYGVLVQAATATSGTAYGLYVNSPSGSVASWAIYATGGADCWFSGDVVVGQDVIPGSTGTGAVGTASNTWSYGTFADYVLIGAPSAPANNLALRAQHTYTDSDATDSFEVVSTVTSEKNDTGTDVQAGRFVAYSNASSAIQNSVAAVYAIGICAATGTGGVTDVWGVWASSGIGTATADVFRCASIYAEPGSRAIAPDYDFGVRVKPHTAGSLASASIYCEGGAVVIDGDEADASFGISPTLNLMGGASYAAATAYAVNLVGNTLNPAILNFENVDITDTLVGGRFKWGFFDGNRKLKLEAESRDGLSAADLIIFDRDSASPTTTFYSSRVVVERTNARLWVIDWDIDISNPFTPGATFDVTFTGAGGGITSSGGAGTDFIANKVNLYSASFADGNYADDFIANQTLVSVPGNSNSVTAYGHWTRMGKFDAYAATTQGNSTAYYAWLTLRGTETAGQGVGKCFEAKISSDASYSERYGFYVADQTMTAATPGTVSMGYMVESMDTVKSNSATTAFRSGQLTMGSGGTSVTNSDIYGVYLGTITGYSSASSPGSNAYGFWLNGITLNTNATYPSTATTFSVGMQMYNINGGSNSYGIYIDGVKGENQTRGLWITNITGDFYTGTGAPNEYAFGVRVDAVRGEAAWGYDLDGVTAVTGNAYGVRVLNVTTSGGGGNGLYINDVFGSGSTYGAQLLNVTSAAAIGCGLYINQVDGGTAAYGIYIDAPNTFTGDEYSLYSRGSCYLGDGGAGVYEVESQCIEDNTSGVGSPVRIVSGILYKQTSVLAAKTNITDLGDTSWVYDLRPRCFEEKNALGLKQYGLIAEEVEAVSPELAGYSFEYGDIVDDDYSPALGEMVFNHKGKKRLTTRKEVTDVMYERLTVVLLNELKKLKDKVSELEAKLN